MGRICILTEEDAQFPLPDFPGRDLVRSLPGKSARVPRLPDAAAREVLSRLRALEESSCSGVLLVCGSKLLNGAAEAFARARAHYAGRLPLALVEVETVPAGLGMLVELAAETAAQGADLTRVERRLRTLAARTFTLFCLPDLQRLAAAGFLSEAQAIAGEVMGLLPLFAFEDGRLAPHGKVRAPRRLPEAFQEFLGEFGQPVRIALTASSAGEPFVQSLRDFAAQLFPQTLFSVHPLTDSLSGLFGARAIALTVMEGNAI